MLRKNGIATSGGFAFRSVLKEKPGSSFSLGGPEVQYRCGTGGTRLRLRAMVTGRREDRQGEPATAQKSTLRLHQASPVRGPTRGDIVSFSGIGPRRRSQWADA